MATLTPLSAEVVVENGLIRFAPNGEIAIWATERMNPQQQSLNVEFYRLGPSKGDDEEDQNEGKEAGSMTIESMGVRIEPLSDGPSPLSNRGGLIQEEAMRDDWRAALMDGIWLQDPQGQRHAPLRVRRIVKYWNHDSPGSPYHEIEFAIGTLRYVVVLKAPADESLGVELDGLDDFLPLMHIDPTPGLPAALLDPQAEEGVAPYPEFSVGGGRIRWVSPPMTDNSVWVTAERAKVFAGGVELGFFYGMAKNVIEEDDPTILYSYIWVGHDVRRMENYLNAIMEPTPLSAANREISDHFPPLYESETNTWHYPQSLQAYKRLYQAEESVREYKYLLLGYEIAGQTVHLILSHQPEQLEAVSDAVGQLLQSLSIGSPAPPDPRD